MSDSFGNTAASMRMVQAVEPKATPSTRICLVRSTRPAERRLCGGTDTQDDE